jgi:hypothetical protein
MSLSKSIPIKSLANTTDKDHIFASVIWDSRTLPADLYLLVDKERRQKSQERDRPSSPDA